jgi:hypothetical protein
VNLPDFAARCGWPAKEPVVRARLEALNLLVTCRRCGGTGIYERNPLDKTCYGCAGRKLKLPPLTARLAATVRERQDRGDLAPYYQRLREMRGAQEEGFAKSLENLVPEMVAFAGARKA